jgi:hypothetical protein
MEERNMISLKDLYSALTQLVIHAESISWNRLYNFLTCNCILLLAWSTISASEPACPGKTAMVLMCLVGGISGIAWWELGRRGRAFLDHYGNHAKRLEEQPNAFDPSVPKGEVEGSDPPREVWPFQFRVEGPLFGKSRYILTWGPLVFTGLYMALAVITFFI